MNIKRELGIWSGSLVAGTFSGMLGFVSVDMGTEFAKEHISVRQEIPFSEVVSPYPEWLPLVVALVMFIVGFSMLQLVMRRR